MQTSERARKRRSRMLFVASPSRSWRRSYSPGFATPLSDGSATATACRRHMSAPHNSDLTDKVAVIMGATSDIGLALATHALERGMKVALVDSDQARLTVALKRFSSDA